VTHRTVKYEHASHRPRQSREDHFNADVPNVIV
jgi:hypothetical protein